VTCQLMEGDFAWYPQGAPLHSGDKWDVMHACRTWGKKLLIQRVRVFVSSTLDELAPGRAEAREAITQLRLIERKREDIWWPITHCDLVNPMCN